MKWCENLRFKSGFVIRSCFSFGNVKREKSTYEAITMFDRLQNCIHFASRLITLRSSSKSNKILLFFCCRKNTKKFCFFWDFTDEPLTRTARGWVVKLSSNCVLNGYFNRNYTGSKFFFSPAYINYTNTHTHTHTPAYIGYELNCHNQKFAK